MIYKVISILLTVVLVITMPCVTWSRSHSCHSDGETMVSASGDRPDWVTRTHFDDDENEYFVGFSTQMPKLEDAKRAANENGIKAVVESMGILSQPKYQEVTNLNLENSTVHDILGSIGFPAFLKNKEVESWYSEKWVTYSRCHPVYSYNVWVLLKVSKTDLVGERVKAEAYLKNVQEKAIENSPSEVITNSQEANSDISEKIAEQVVNTVSANSDPVSIQEENIGSTDDNKSSVKKDNTLMWGIIGSVILAGIGAGSYFAFKKGSSSTGSPASAATGGGGAVGGNNGGGAIGSAGGRILISGPISNH